ncbi:MAG TPA: hypothetical protein VKB84_12670 [Candidatus Binataceae bacterium]|nr:hypothetical protein [Candidatus Binataceae bacterium]
MITRSSLIVALALIIAAALPGRAAEPNKSDLLEQMAREKFGALSHAEVLLLRSAPERDLEWAGPRDDPDDPSNNPVNSEAWGPDRTIRAPLVAWLASDPVASRLVHPSGAGIKAARIAGLLDLSYQKVPFPLTLIRCVIKQGVDISNARLRDLDLRASITGPIMGEMATVDGDVTLTFGAYDQVTFYRASISGTIDFSAARVQSAEVPAISGVEASVGGDVLFHQGLASSGPVDFSTNAMVDFRLIRIGHALSFNHARFFGPGENGLNAERATIQGPLYWVAISHTSRTQLDLADARCSELWDDQSSWPAPGNLMLTGFQYGGFGGDSPATAESRLAWIARQPRGFHAQPYAELAKALMAGGESDDAIQVEIAQRVAQRRDGGLGMAERIWNALLQVTIGYGFIPLRALWWILGFVAFGTVLFRWGYALRAVSPTEGSAYDSFMQSGTTPPHYPPFNAFVYSLENFLPVVDLHQGEYWRPNPSSGAANNLHPADEQRAYAGIFLRWYLWIHILAGWILTPLLAAGLSGLIHVG